MIRKLSQSHLKQLAIGMCYLVLMLIWSWVSFQTNSFESESGYFEIGALLKFKISLPILVLTGRSLFNQYRLGSQNPWLYPLSLFLVGWSAFDKLAKVVNLHYGLLIGADIIIWSMMIREILETINVIFRFWKGLPKVNYAMFTDLWSKLGNDLVKLGIWLTSLLGLTFLYLVSFFMLDALLYSRLLLIPLLVIGGSLYLLVFSKMKTWVDIDLKEIESELGEGLNWRQVKDDPDLTLKTPWFQYLTLIHNYLKNLEKPVLLLKPCLLYLVCMAIILCLPFFCGRVIEL